MRQLCFCKTIVFDGGDSFVKNINKLHTTKMGAERIKRNCRLETEDALAWCKEQIANKAIKTERIGKNWYILTERYKITVNAHSYTVITAHELKR